ncbi:immunity 8 family protein [Xenorhabdus bovienii]|uniref:immunity 8 family protein n=1 Tax=Xenorhabdus bovienii TaxID=40576 RepID=UPI0023B2BC18|nr:immunity 8 family protein [Xenorhabdus bovienii]MDE9436697.1 immunity 8 family protein [Xenorhabdus bovienii]MDE9466017.1 immunity 8 family protein [Xenorhabdus bovienii]MDE9498233.1 immunity 8 family protein [Xenorhabdus bovienii]MDE9566054.1 immunity 8 family protein [Xenorhabdus bovienii]
MKANLKALWSDHFLLEEFVPPDNDNFSLWIELSIGVRDEEGADYFQVQICTPEWLCTHKWEPELMRHLLLVRRYDLNEITKIITDYIDQCEGDDWMEIAQKLSRVFSWEYEDYQA